MGSDSILFKNLLLSNHQTDPVTMRHWDYVLTLSCAPHGHISVNLSIYPGRPYDHIPWKGDHGLPPRSPLSQKTSSPQLPKRYGPNLVRYIRAARSHGVVLPIRTCLYKKPKRGGFASNKGNLFLKYFRKQTARCRPNSS